MNRSIDLRFRPNERQIHDGANGMVVRKDVNKMQMSAKVFDQREGERHCAQGWRRKIHWHKDIAEL